MKLTVGKLIELNNKQYSPYIEDKLPLIIARRLCDADKVNILREETKNERNRNEIRV